MFPASRGFITNRDAPAAVAHRRRASRCLLDCREPAPEPAEGGRCHMIDGNLRPVTGALMVPGKIPFAKYASRIYGKPHQSRYLAGVTFSGPK